LLRLAPAWSGAKLALELFSRHARRFAGSRHIEIARQRISGRANRWQQAVDRLALAAKIAEPAAALEDLDLAIEYVERLRSGPLEPLGADACDECVGVVAVGEGDDANHRAAGEQRVAGAKRRLEPRLIAVVQEKHVLGVLAQQGDLLLGERRAEWSDDFVDAGEHEPYRVEVTFDDEDAVVLADRLFRRVHPVQQRALREDLGLRRVEILRLTLAEHPTAEADGTPRRIGDRKDQPMPKARPRLRPVFSDDEQAGGKLPIVAEAERRQRGAHRIGVARRVAELEPISIGLRQPSRGQVVASNLAALALP